MSCPSATFTATAGTVLASDFSSTAGTVLSAGFSSTAETVLSTTFTVNCANTMAVYVLNLNGITGLTTGTALAAVTVATLPANAVAVINLVVASPYVGEAQATYRIRLAAGSTQSLPRIVTSTNNALYVWELMGVVFTNSTYQGSICELNVTDNKFYPRYAQTVDGVPTSGLADAGFSLP